MVNPYFCYVMAFVLSLVTYLLGWSDVYPPLSTPVVLFLIATILVFSFLGIIMAKSKIITFKRIDTGDHAAPILLTLFIYALWTVEFFYAGGIPLLKILLRQPYDYRVFGVPSLHVFVVTFSSFYTIYLFHLYFSHKQRLILTLYFINLIAALLIYNRGMLLFNLSASVLLYLIYKNRITWKQVVIGSGAIIAFLLLFGALGSLRVSREGKKVIQTMIF